jgi:predicted transcriptional regulator
MIAAALRFMRPSRELREFYILRAVENNPSASQRHIAREARVSSTMVNNYLGEMVSREWIDIAGETNRSYEYRITDQGRRRKSDLLFQISKEVVRMYAMMKQDFAGRMRRLASEGVRRVVLFGASETGELALAASAEAGLQIVGIVDNDPLKHGKSVGSLQVEPPAAIAARRPDAVLIASHGHADEMEQQVRPLESQGIRIARI